MIDFKCPNCKAAMSAPDSLAGRTDDCPSCGGMTRIPDGPPARLEPRADGPPIPTQPNRPREAHIFRGSLLDFDRPREPDISRRSLLHFAILFVFIILAIWLLVYDADQRPKAEQSARDAMYRIERQTR